MQNIVRNVRMKGWHIHCYGNLNELQFSNKSKLPIIRTSTDILVKVNSSAVNPIDVAMVGGYGSRFLNVLRCNRDNIEFPLTLGREFSGTIIQKGMGCSSHIKTGDLVFGVVPPWRMGCHAEYVVVSESCVSKKPDNISVLESGGVLYAGLTAWSGLFISGLLGGVEGALTAHGGGRGKRVLVLGAAGGVGTSAIQILNAENVSVIASCSTDAIEIVKRLGVDHVIDYTNQEQINDFSSFGPYDIILDCTGQGPEYAEKFNWSYKNYVTFSSPFLKNIDNNGLGLGMYENLKDIIDINTKSIITKKGVVKWGYFLPAPNGITYLSNLIKRKKFLPLIDSIYEFENAKDAYEKVEKGHLRGKVIINMESKN